MINASNNSEFAPESKKEPANLIKFHYLKKTLLIGMQHPSKAEKKEIENGEIVFKLIEMPNFIFILFKIGILDWNDVAYSFYLDLRSENKNYEEILSESSPRKFNLVLFDTKSKSVVVRRKITFSDEFVQNLRHLVLEQYKNPNGFKEYGRSVKKIYKKYTSEQLAMSKSVTASCKIVGEKSEKTIDVIYDQYGYGTNKRIPNWAFKEIHNPKIYGIITKENIPKDLLRKSVSKCTYKKVKGKYWKIVVYKTKRIKKKKDGKKIENKFI